MRSFRKSIAMLLALTTVLSMSVIMPVNAYASSVSGYEDRGSIIYQYNDGTIDSINRLARTTESRGEAAENSWTIFVYMCGSDLETNSGCASKDIAEMLNANGVTTSDVKVVIETGGADQWQNNIMKNDELERYVIDYSAETPALKQVGVIPDAEQYKYGMSDERTLEDFITWGVANYPADKMGFILWDHGGGSISGACVDETVGNYTISLSEIDAAFSHNFDSMTDRFEFIGFDCCLMGTLETANVLAPYTRYMYGSEESEPGCGWEYTSMVNAIVNDPSMDGGDLGEIVCDNFYKGCVAYGSESIPTMACYYLGKYSDGSRGIDDLITTLNNGFKTIYDECVTGELDYKEIAVAANDAENFGGNNSTSGYHNMIDVMDFINELPSDDPNISAIQASVKTALKNVVEYSVHGSGHPYACGMSMYYPLCIQSDNEFEKFAAICPLPCYYNILDKLSEGEFVSYDTDGTKYDASEHLKSVKITEGKFNPYQDDYRELEEGDLGVESIHFDENGYLTLRFKNFKDVGSVTGAVYVKGDDEYEECFLGTTDDVVFDYDNYTVRDNFDGTWASIKGDDGYPVYLPLVVSNVSQTSSGAISSYTCSIEIKEPDESEYKDAVMLLECTRSQAGESTVWNWTVTGVTEKTGEDGMASRVMLIPDGSKMKVLYDYTDDGWESSSLLESSEFTFSTETAINFDTLADDIYEYGFVVRDIYGNAYYSEEVDERVSGRDIYLDTSHVFKFGDSVKRSSGGGSSHSGSSGSSGQSTVSVPVSGDSGTVKVEAKVKEGNAEVKEISAADISNVSTSENVILDLSGTGKQVTSVSLTASTIENIAGSNAQGVEIRLSDGVTAAFDTDALKAIAEQAGGADVKFSLQTGSDAEKLMNDAQKIAVSEMKAATVLDVSFTADGKVIGSFDGGSGSISVKVADPTKNYRAWYVAPDGSKVSCPVTIDRTTGTVTFLYRYLA